MNKELSLILLNLEVITHNAFPSDKISATFPFGFCISVQFALVLHLIAEISCRHLNSLLCPPWRNFTSLCSSSVKRPFMTDEMQISFFQTKLPSWFKSVKQDTETICQTYLSEVNLKKTETDQSSAQFIQDSMKIKVPIKKNKTRQTTENSLSDLQKGLSWS